MINFSHAGRRHAAATGHAGKSFLRVGRAAVGPPVVSRIAVLSRHHEGTSGAQNSRKPTPASGASPAAPLFEVATPRSALSQLDDFKGTWEVPGLGEHATLAATRRGKWLFVTHPAKDGRNPRYADTFSDENGSFVRRDQTPETYVMFVSGGWQGKRWEWTRADCSERITYDKTDNDTMIVTEEEGVPSSCDERFGRCTQQWRVVRRYEAHRRA